jgi:hypothetical protein
MRTTVLAALALLCLGQAASAQYWAWYPSYYGGGYYRDFYYGGGLPYRGVGGYMRPSYAYHPQPWHYAPVHRYNPYWAPPRYYGGLPGGGEW